MNSRNKSRDILKNVGLNLLSEGRTIRIRASGYSMYPCIRPGAVILIEPLSIKGLPRAGEVIAVKRNEGLVVHRLVRVVKQAGREMYIARGDSNTGNDLPVPVSSVAGRIVKVEFRGGEFRPVVAIPSKGAYLLNRLKVIWLILRQKLRNRLG